MQSEVAAKMVRHQLEYNTHFYSVQGKLEAT